MHKWFYIYWTNGYISPQKISLMFFHEKASLRRDRGVVAKFTLSLDEEPIVGIDIQALNLSLKGQLRWLPRGHCWRHLLCLCVDDWVQDWSPLWWTHAVLLHHLLLDGERVFAVGGSTHHHLPLVTVVDKIELVLIWRYLNVLINSHLAGIESTHLIDTRIEANIIASAEHSVRRVVSGRVLELLELLHLILLHLIWTRDNHIFLSLWLIMMVVMVMMNMAEVRVDKAVVLNRLT